MEVREGGVGHRTTEDELSLRVEADEKDGLWKQDKVQMPTKPASHVSQLLLPPLKEQDNVSLTGWSQTSEVSGPCLSLCPLEESDSHKLHPGL